jgi:hypothetical protein
VFDSPRTLKSSLIATGAGINLNSLPKHPTRDSIGPLSAFVVVSGIELPFPIWCEIMIWLNRIALLLPCVALGFAGCGGGGFLSPGTPAAELYVNPSSVIVAAGSTTAFTAAFMQVPTAPGSLTWSVTPAIGGTITSAGAYTASATAGQYAVIATWTPANSQSAVYRAAATVEVLPVPQPDAALNPNFVQASGGLQVSGATQNALIVGQPTPFVISTDPDGDIQTSSGFTPPVVCTGSSTTC